MLGTRIAELRKRQGFSVAALARLSGLSAQKLMKLESGKLTLPVTYAEMIRIADVLRVPAGEYAYLLRLINSTRRFHAYNVGLAKTGTTSIAGIFIKNYRCRHEHFFQSSTEMVRRFKKGKADSEEVRRFLRRRDNENLLEMDSSSFNCEFIDFLVEEFGQAKFIFTMRDCYSWLDSIVNMLLDEGNQWPQWLKVHFRFLFGIRASTPVHDIKAFRKELYRGLDRPLRYWANTNARILQCLPKERSLLVRTHEINKSLQRIATFIGVPPATLDSRYKHLFKRKKKYQILQNKDRDFLEEKFDKVCGPLMREYFPEFTLEAFFEKEA